MTRENKLALVVGFALILFVGILISDHFSTARNQASANLSDGRTDERLVSTRRDDPQLLHYERPQPGVSPRSNRSRGGTPAVNTTSHTTAASTSGENEAPPSGVIEMGVGTVNGAGSGSADRVPSIFHDVKPGESLTSICRRYYGSDALVRKLAEFNGLNDPNALRARHRLRIPAAEALLSGRDSAVRRSSEDALPEAPKLPRTYTVKRGDTLSEIAQRELGSATRWRELYELNKAAIDDPDNVRAGTVLTLPD